MVQKIPQSGISGNSSFRNLLINGDMKIAQRAVSASGLTGSGYATLDRWYVDINNAGTWTISQTTTVPTGQGFFNSQKWDCTTADGSLASGDRIFYSQRIEDRFCTPLKKGTSSAVSITVSFWVRSNKTGTYICEVYDSQNARHISKSYTIDSADTWEKKIIVFPGDTTGSFANDAGVGLQVDFWLAAGTDYTSGTLATSWQANDATDRAVGQLNLADSTSNEWYITGVQLEAGDQATDFEHLPFDINLLRCQRYCEVLCDTRSSDTGTFSSGDADESLGVLGACHGTRYAYMTFRFTTAKRSNAPTLVSSNDTDHFIMYNVLTNDKFTNIVTSGVFSHFAMECYFDTGATSNLTNGAAGMCRSHTAGAKLLILDEI